MSLGLGTKAEPFNLPGVDGRNHSLSDYQDKEAIAVTFSCNHCPYVQAWEDRMLQVQADYASKGVQLIAINANDSSNFPNDSFTKMQERAESKGFNFPYLFDEPQTVAKAYGAERTPEVFLFDKGLQLRYHGAIDDNYEDSRAVKHNYLRDALDAVLAGREPPLAETEAVGCTIKWK